jgi:fumarylpyruvate hydrolase
MTHVIKAPEPVAIPVAGSDQTFPANRIFCVGRNYAEHAREMGHDPDREPPFFFEKHTSSLLFAPGPDGADFPYPQQTSDVHHEIELVVGLAKGGNDIPVERAYEHVWGYAVGIDMTRRDLQGVAKKMGRPWEVGKSFDHSAPIGMFHPLSEAGHMSEAHIRLDVNGEQRQIGDMNAMIWKIPETISYLSGLFTLQPGDLIMTGTPAGVGPVQKGDVLEGHINGLSSIKITVT